MEEEEDLNHIKILSYTYNLLIPRSTTTTVHVKYYISFVLLAASWLATLLAWCFFLLLLLLYYFLFLFFLLFVFRFLLMIDVVVIEKDR